MDWNCSVIGRRGASASSEERPGHHHAAARPQRRGVGSGCAAPHELAEWVKTGWGSHEHARSSRRSPGHT
eukprot:7158853-Prymnesium_polylepis.1